MLIDAFMCLFSNTSATYCDLSTQKRREFTNDCLSKTFMLLQKFLKPDLTLEIGARDAKFSRDLKASLPSTRVVAFEASPMYHKIWSELHHYDQIGVEYLNLAISDHCGTIKFNQPVDVVDFNGAGIGSLHSRVDGAFAGIKEEVVETQAVTLDSYLESMQKIGNISLWIDVEGASREVFDGLKATLASVAKGGISSIFIEVESKARWHSQWLDRDVFQFLIDNDFIPVARDHQYKDQYNVIFIRSNLIGERIWELVSGYHHQLQTTRLKAGMTFRNIWMAFQLQLGQSFFVGAQKYRFSSLMERYFSQILHNEWDRRLHYELLYVTKEMGEEYLDVSLHAEFSQQTNRAIFSTLDTKRDVVKLLFENQFPSIPFEIFYAHELKSSCFTLRMPFTPIGSIQKYCELIVFFINATHSLVNTLPVPSTSI